MAKCKVGRPKWEPPPRTKYRDGCKQIEDGATIETVSRPYFNGNFQTVYQFMRENPQHEFTVAIKQAQDTSNIEDEKTLRVMSKQQFAALRMRLLNRNGSAWKDRVELTGENGGPVEISAEMPSVHDILKALKGARTKAG